MTKKRVLPVKRYETATFPVQETLLKTPAPCMPTNLAEEKEKFLRSGKTPKFHLKDRSKVEELASKTKNHIRFDLFGEAQYILEKVRDGYGNGEFYLEHAFGPRITKDEATPILLKYIAENNLPESLKINWCENLTCSAKMVWTGPMVNSNRPELRKYSLWLNASDENPYMRESGIQCLMDHEIGTHFYRSFNDGFQPWYAERERFGLRKLGAFEGQCTEEGLAAIHTALRGRVRYLWSSAMAYYIACKAAEMTFKELFDHLGRYTSNPDYRWKQAMRVKRGLEDPNDLGGFGNDQCYFEGAVNILRKMDDIDFQLLMTGKICYDELDRIKRVARKDVIQFPNFMKNMNAYRKSMRKMVTFNGLDGFHPQHGPPDAYLKHLENKKRGKNNPKTKKVRPNSKLSMLSKTVTNKVKNKKSSKTEKVVEENEEVKSFNCSQPFINMHLRKKALSATENILRHESEQLKYVKELTNNLLDSDNSLEKQIDRLKDIVKCHEWTNDEEPDIDNLEDAQLSQRNDPSPGNGSGERITLPMISKELCPSNYETNREMNASACGNIETGETNIDSSRIIQSNLMIGEMHSHELCTSASSDSIPSDKNEDKQAIWIPENDIMKDGLFDTKELDQNSRRKNSRNILSKRRLAPNVISNKGRQLLHTPVADLSGYDSVLANIERDKSFIETSGIKKRLSLSHSGKTKNRLSYNENTGKLTPLGLVDNLIPMSEEKTSRIRTPDMNFKMDGSGIFKHEANKNLQDQNISNPLAEPYSILSQSPSLPENRPGFNLRRRKLVSHRPLSTGSERILKFHWMNISNNVNVEKQTKPQKSNSNAFSDVNNNFTTIKHMSTSTDGSFQNVFHQPMVVNVHQGPIFKRN